jgi:hypothetical protein
MIPKFWAKNLKLLLLWVFEFRYFCYAAVINFLVKSLPGSFREKKSYTFSGFINIIYLMILGIYFYNSKNKKLLSTCLIFPRWRPSPFSTNCKSQQFKKKLKFSGMESPINYFLFNSTCGENCLFSN